jgi:single-strand DNA-binding protein
MSINISIIDGNLTRDPESAYTQNNTAITKFAIANNKKYKDKSGELKEQVSFIDVECWGKLAEVAQKYLVKGSRVLITGEIVQDRWQDKETQANRSKVKITASKIDFIGSKKEGGEAPVSTGAPVDNRTPEQIQDFDNDPMDPF